MVNTISGLMNGSPVESWYRWAESRWSDLIAKHGRGDDLVAELASEQDGFEEHCGGRDIGKEVMGVSGVAYYHTKDGGFGDRATRDKAREIIDAIELSNCSQEVKIYSELARDLFSLGDE